MDDDIRTQEGRYPFGLVLAERDHIGTCAPINRLLTKQHRQEEIIPGFAIKFICTKSTGNCISSIPSFDAVIPVTTDKGIVEQVTDNHVILLAAVDIFNPGQVRLGVENIKGQDIEILNRDLISGQGIMPLQLAQRFQFEAIQLTQVVCQKYNGCPVCQQFAVDGVNKPRRQVI